MFHGPSLSSYLLTTRTVVTLTGEFDLSWSPALRAQLSEALTMSPPPPDVLIDLSQVTFMDSTALGVLVGAHNSATALGGTLSLVGATDPVHRLLRITQIDQLLPSYATVDAAIGGP
jgi:anti-sigma B factor antagonist